MTEGNLNSGEAKDLFIEMLVPTVYDGAIRGMTSMLEKGPPGRKPPEEIVKLHRWFLDLKKEDQDCVAALIRDAVDAAIFGCLVLLDGMTGGPPVAGVVSDFALYLQTYENEEARQADKPKSGVRVNPAWTGEYLHDLFHYALEEKPED